jgi:hypothetical protein
MDDQRATAPEPEVWLSGPIEGVLPLLMPAAHALLGAERDLATAAAGLAHEELWARPGGAASVGFHLRHIAGSLSRLYSYARGLPLSEAQRAALRVEGEPGTPPASADELLRGVSRAIAEAVAVLRATQESELLVFRGVGRAQLPSNTLGLLFHGAEHTQRHTGQVITTAKIVRGR